MRVTMSEVPHPARFEKKKNKPILPGGDAPTRSAAA
jgi:hypothetical protein